MAKNLENRSFFWKIDHFFGFLDLRDPRYPTNGHFDPDRASALTTSLRVTGPHPRLSASAKHSKPPLTKNYPMCASRTKGRRFASPFGARSAPYECAARTIWARSARPWARSASQKSTRETWRSISPSAIFCKSSL